MIDQILDHFDRAKARLLAQFQGLPILEAVLESLCIQIQDLETVIFDMQDQRSLYGATGATLDLWGQLLNRPRQGIVDDNLYRIVLLAKVAQNVSQGTPEDVIQVYKLLMRADYVEYVEDLLPASFALTAVGSQPIGDIDDIKAAVRSSKPGGVRIDLFQTVPGNPFVFDGDPDPNGRGFGTTADNTVGGVLASIV